MTFIGKYAEKGGFPNRMTLDVCHQGVTSGNFTKFSEW